MRESQRRSASDGILNFPDEIQDTLPAIEQYARAYKAFEESTVAQTHALQDLSMSTLAYAGAISGRSTRFCKAVGQPQAQIIGLVEAAKDEQSVADFLEALTATLSRCSMKLTRVIDAYMDDFSCGERELRSEIRRLQSSGDIEHLSKTNNLLSEHYKYFMNEQITVDRAITQSSMQLLACISEHDVKPTTPKNHGHVGASPEPPSRPIGDVEQGLSQLLDIDSDLRSAKDRAKDTSTRDRCTKCHGHLRHSGHQHESQHHKVLRTSRNVSDPTPITSRETHFKSDMTNSTPRPASADTQTTEASPWRKSLIHELNSVADDVATMNLGRTKVRAKDLCYYDMEDISTPPSRPPRTPLPLPSSIEPDQSLANTVQPDKRPNASRSPRSHTISSVKPKHSPSKVIPARHRAHTFEDTSGASFPPKHEGPQRTWTESSIPQEPPVTTRLFRTIFQTSKSRPKPKNDEASKKVVDALMSDHTIAAKPSIARKTRFAASVEDVDSDFAATWYDM